MPPISDPKLDPTRHLLRHTLVALAYRARKTLRDAPESFAAFQVGEAGTRSPLEIVSHMGDVFDWALALSRGGEVAWRENEPRLWDLEVERFFAALEALDGFLASGAAVPAERLFQGPIADVLTHVGQLAMLRRLAGAPIQGENYFKAEIAVGQVGWETGTEA
jgi:hypothetical protein